MKNYRKNASKVFFDYTAAMILFVIFLYAVFSYSGEKFMTYLPYYSALMFALTFVILFFDMKGVGENEKRPQYNLRPYPLKGLVYGFLGFSPFILLELVSVFLVFQDQFASRVEHLVINTMLGPMYFIIGMMGEKPSGYVAATLVIPAIAMFGYIWGYFGLMGKKGNSRTEKGAAGQTFVKSPWHPTNKPVQTAQTKKKKKKDVV